jgi:hypothetical protein
MTYLKTPYKAGYQWLMPVILAMWQNDIRRTEVPRPAWVKKFADPI